VKVSSHRRSSPGRDADSHRRGSPGRGADSPSRSGVEHTCHCRHMESKFLFGLQCTISTGLYYLNAFSEWMRLIHRQICDLQERLGVQNNMKLAAADTSVVQQPALTGLPYTSAKELEEWACRMQSDNQQRDHAVRYFRQLGGSRASSMTNKIMENLMSNMTGAEFSLRGHNRGGQKKLSFSALGVIPMISGKIKADSNDITDVLHLCVLCFQFQLQSLVNLRRAQYMKWSFLWPIGSSRPITDSSTESSSLSLRTSRLQMTMPDLQRHYPMMTAAHDDIWWLCTRLGKQLFIS